MTIRNFDVKKTVMCQTTPDMRTYTRVQCAVCLICTVLCHFNTIYISFVIVPWKVFHYYCNNSQFKVNIYCMCYMGMFLTFQFYFIQGWKTLNYLAKFITIHLIPTTQEGQFTNICKTNSNRKMTWIYST